MKLLAVIASIIALIIGAVQVALTGGLFDVSPGYIGLITAAATAVSILGVQPFQISEGIAKWLGAMSGILGAVIAVHAAQITRGANAHPWIWSAAGALAVLMGIIGKHPFPRPASQPPAGPIVLVLAVALTCGGATCRQPGPVPPAEAGTLVDCSDAALHAAELKIIPDVENALALGNYASVTAALASIVASLAVTDGAPLALAEATCVVDWLVAKLEAAKAQTADPLEASKAAFGARWVSEHGANVKPASAL